MVFLKKHFEPLFWSCALAFLFFTDPHSSFTICPLKLLGADWCPGCGIGRSIHYAMHFQFRQSWEAHWLGIPALGTLIYTIFRKRITTKNTLHESATF
jgi:hypothetical protein